MIRYVEKMEPPVGGRSLKRMRIRIAAAAGCAALAAAACGTASANAGRPGGPATPVRAVTSVRPAQSPRQVAEAAMARMLAEFRPPPGAKRSGPVNVSPLSGELDTLAGPDVAARTVWWRAPGTMRSVLTWVAAHEPAVLGHPLGGSAGAGRTLAEEDSYSVPPDPGVIWAGSLDVWVEADGPDNVAIRADSEVSWFPAKPPSERIPAAARAVTITALPALYPLPGRSAGKSPKPVTVTSPATVTKIANVVDGLPRFPPGTMSCPAGGGPGLRLTFRAAPHGPALATVTYTGDGCSTVQVVINGKQQPDLWYAWQLTKQVLKLAGLHWPGYS